MLRHVHILRKGKQLERSEEGVAFKTNLNFDEHISSKIYKASSFAGLIRRSFQYLDVPMFKMLFTALVRPNTLNQYGTHTWKNT